MFINKKETGFSQNNTKITGTFFNKFLKGGRNEKDFALFLLVGVFTGVASGIYTTVFNNFLQDVYRLTSEGRGIVEIPREFPGVLIMVILALLSFLGDIRVSSIAMLLASLGMVGLGLFSPTFASMLVWMMVLSLGTHIFIPLAPGIGMNLSKKEEYGVRLGRFNAYSLAATIFGYAIVWAGFKYFHLSYKAAFILSAVFYVLASFALNLMHSNKPEKHKIRFVFRRKYMLYYILCIVNGARKQIFLTFAPWVLIQVFHLDPPVFAVLGVIIAAVSIMTRTIIGNAIDRLGERFVLSAGAVVLFIICIGYSFAGDVFPASIAVVIIAGCYVIDNSMNAVEMARSIYVKKIAVDPGDVTPTLSAGTSFDHIVAMSIPTLGGILWASAGYKYVFFVAALIAVINFILSLRIKIE